MRISFPILCISLVLVYSCSPSKKFVRERSNSISSLRFINEYIVPHGMELDGTAVGGLSGIDYDQQRDQYYLICDDPSVKGPARFYTAKLLISEKGIDSVIFKSVTAIMDPGGKSYPDITKDLLHSADLEAMRYDPRKEILIRSSEGQRRTRNGQNDLQNPDIVIMDKSGRWIDSFALPANLYMRADERGPRHNSVFEGLDFGDDDQHLYVSVEEALYEDGPKAGTGDTSSWVRFLVFDIKTRKQVAQYAYEIGPVPYPANPPGAFKINGVTDILYLGNKKFIVIERAFSTGRTETDIKIYLADAAGAEDISQVTSLKQYTVSKPVQKKLILDMNKELLPEVYNVEGVSIGPLLPDGHRSLVFVTDNNFNPREKTQFLLFEIIP